LSLSLILSRLIGCDFDGQDSLPALNALAVSQISFLNFLPVDVSSVERAEVAQEGARRSDFKYALVTREISVVGQAEMRRLSTPDKERVVLVEDETASGMRA